MVDKQKMKRRVGIVVIVIVILAVLVVGFITFCNLLNDTYAKGAKAIVLTRAKEECYQAKMRSAVCDGLYAETAPPPWGPNWWLVYVYSSADTSFGASARVDFDPGGRPNILEYSVDEIN